MEIQRFTFEGGFSEKPEILVGEISFTGTLSQERKQEKLSGAMIAGTEKFLLEQVELNDEYLKFNRHSKELETYLRFELKKDGDVYRGTGRIDGKDIPVWIKVSTIEGTVLNNL